MDDNRNLVAYLSAVDQEITKSGFDIAITRLGPMLKLFQSFCLFSASVKALNLFSNTSVRNHFLKTISFSL